MGQWPSLCAHRVDITPRREGSKTWMGSAWEVTTLCQGPVLCISHSWGQAQIPALRELLAQDSLLGPCLPCVLAQLRASSSSAAQATPRPPLPWACPGSLPAAKPLPSLHSAPTAELGTVTSSCWKQFGGGEGGGFCLKYFELKGPLTEMQHFSKLHKTDIWSVSEKSKKNWEKVLE